MAKKKTTVESGAEESFTLTNRETMRWVIGFVLFVMGLISVASVLFYYFDWKADYSIINGINSDSPLFDQERISNPCGSMGAWIGELLVGRSFGLVGIVIPVVLTILGVRILRKESLKINKLLLFASLIVILGSLTFGFVFSGVEVFNSGLGGAFGVELSRSMIGVVGGVGSAILLLAGWIVTGVFVNRNFIRTVNNAGNAAVGGGEKIVDMVKNSVKQREVNKEDVSLDEEITPTTAEIKEQPHTPSPQQKPTTIQEPEPVVEPSPEEQNEPSPFMVLTEDDAIGGERETVNTIYSRRRSDVLELVDVDENGNIIESNEPVDNDGIVIIRQNRDPRMQMQDDIEEITTDEELTAEDPGEEIIIPLINETEPQGVVVTVEANELEELDIEDLEEDLYDPLRELNKYERPSPLLLEDYQSDEGVTDDEIYENKAKIEETLKHFGIPISRIMATVGPTITLYEIIQAQGVKISKIQGLENDIAQSLKAFGIRIIAPIPGRGTIGIEVPNRHKQVVSMLSAVRSPQFKEIKAELPIVIGRTIQNKNYAFDLAKMPHLLVAGATGQGKSVGLNAIITSLLYKKHPAELKLVMIDPKMVEFTPYKNLEHHFMAKMESEEDVIITDPKKAVYTLNSLCEEMEKRLKLLSKASVRNIVEYNDKFKKRRLLPTQGHFYMPYIVVIVDEFADLIMMTREVEAPVMRLAQKARAVGIHLIIATQRPDVKVITGGIKANFPARIAFRVMQMIDSRTIIDQPGANQLIGRGDMLFSKDGELTRIQCALVETEEVERIVTHISKQQGYTEAYRLPDFTPDGGGDVDLGSESGAAIKYDSLFAEIARNAVAGGSLSTSYIQRNYEVGFNRAGRIMTQLERAGIVGRQEGAKPREILFHDSQSLEAKLQSLGVS
ncbi:MAG: DNA translocase FtsK [Rikenellaceae bacterium]